jgi:hypothetical protein
VTRLISLAVVTAALLAGCGGSSRTLGDGQWFGKLVSVDVADRRLEFAPACDLNRSGRWVAARQKGRATIGLSAHPDLEIYFRPNGEVSAGHGESAGVRQLAQVAAHGRLPDFPPGWFVTVRSGAVTSVVEDSGLRSSGKADKRANACVWSRRTRAFVK